MSNSITPAEKSRSVVLSGMMAFVQAVIQRFKGEELDPLVPTQASSSNQLADKAFVNSSIATATATYRGSFNLVSDLQLTVSATQSQIATALASAISTADSNDYCYVQVPTADLTPTEIARVDRYKHNGTAWAFEYSLNNSGFTAAEWAAIQSGITSGLVAKLTALPTMAELTLLLGAKQDSVGDCAAIGFGSGTCSTAASTVAKELVLSNYELINGGILVVTFTYGISVASATLDVNSKGAKAVYYKGAALAADRIGAGDVVMLQYDGTNYNVIHINSTPVYTAVSGTTFKPCYMVTR